MYNFDHDVMFLTVNDEKYHMPLNLSMLGSGYSFSESIDPENSNVKFLYYNGDFTGVEITLSKNSEYISEQNFEYIQATHFNIGEDISFTVNGISIDSTLQDVEEVFGEPDGKQEDGDEIYYEYYLPDDNIFINFSFMKNSIAVISLGYGASI